MNFTTERIEALEAEVDLLKIEIEALKAELRQSLNSPSGRQISRRETSFNEGRDQDNSIVTW